MLSTGDVSTSFYSWNQMGYYDGVKANIVPNILSSERSAGFLPSQPHVINSMTTVPAEQQNRLAGNKNYELTDHLGNVHATVSDRKKTTSGSSILLADLKSGNNYYPGGMLQPGRTFSSSDYRFGFNSQEKVDEISGSGNHNTALFWEYDTRLVRRWNLDPKPIASNSNYSVFANNPILFVDLLGDSAWEVKNQWNDDFIKQYRNTLSSTTNKFREEGKTFTCEDLGLDVLMTFSRDNNLPFQWQTGDKSFDASTDEYKDYETFSEDVKKYTGARDFARKENTINVGYEGLSRGDIAVMTAKGRTNPNHVQLITSLHIDEGVRKGFNAVQGNFNWLGRAGSNNPNSWLYMGVPVQSGYYSKDMDSWTNFSEGKVTTSFFESHYSVQFRRFNFSSWNTNP